MNTTPPTYTRESARKAEELRKAGWLVLPDLHHARDPRTGQQVRVSDAYERHALSLAPGQENVRELMYERGR
jgi:hypothetical protein